MKTIIVLVSVISLSACASQTLNQDHGVSTASNIAAQTVNPSAATEGSTAEGMEGMSASDAMNQYKEADNSNRGERLVRDMVN